MKTPQIPANEAERIEAVRRLNILDTGFENAFDRITRLVAHVMETPMAAVTIVDTDRQWFKSAVGLPVRETPRSVSFCGHAINADKLFVVTNAKQDERFSDNPLVTGEPDIAFYIGIPLASIDGQKVGTLCAIGDEPKEVSEQQKNLLRDLAALVESELRLRESSNTDPLTGLLNRRRLRELADTELARARRSGKPLAVLVIDVDDFKRLNDTHGHDAGDGALQTLAHLLSDRVRRPGDLVARTGGDEFVVALVDCNERGARALAYGVMAGLKKAPDAIHRVGVSIGVAAVKRVGPDHSIQALIKQADLALYEAKRRRRGTLEVRSDEGVPAAQPERATR